VRRLSVSAEQQVFVGMQPVALTHTHTHTRTHTHTTIRIGLTHVTANLTRSNAERRKLKTILIHLTTRPYSDSGGQTPDSYHKGQVCVCVCVRACDLEEARCHWTRVSRNAADHPTNVPQSWVYPRRYMTSAINSVINASKFTLAALRNI
jgi:hypothetical protein